MEDKKILADEKAELKHYLTFNLFYIVIIAILLKRRTDKGAGPPGFG